jgi:hypothetical protein
LLLTVLPVKRDTIQVFPVVVHQLEAVDHVRTVVREAGRVRQGLLATMDGLAMQADPEHPETQAAHPLACVNKLLRHRVIRVPPVHPVHQAVQARQAMPVPTAITVKEEATHSLDQQDLKDLTDPLANQALMDNLAHPVRMLNRNKAAKAHLAPQETPAHPDHLDQLDNLANPEDLAHQGQRDLTETQEHPEMMVSKANRAVRAVQEVEAKRVSARNTAPSTEVSSSRTALADVSLTFEGYKNVDLPTTTCPMNTTFLLVAQKTAIYYVSLYCCAIVGFPFPWSSSRFSLFFK